MVSNMEKTVLRASALFFCIILSQLKITSGEPKSEVASTHDLELKCNWKGFELLTVFEVDDEIVRLQIIKKSTAQNTEDTILATVYADNQVSASRSLKSFHPFHKVAGVLDDHPPAARVELTLYRVDQTDWHNGDYECQFIYTKDNKLFTQTIGETISIWNTTPVSVPSSDSSEEFNITLRKSIYSLCQVSDHDMNRKAGLKDTNKKRKHNPVCSIQEKGSITTIRTSDRLALRVFRRKGGFNCDTVIPVDFQVCNASDFNWTIEISSSANDSQPLQCPPMHLLEDICQGSGTDAQEPHPNKESNESSGRSADQPQVSTGPSCSTEIVVSVFVSAICVAIAVIMFFFRKSILESKWVSHLRKRICGNSGSDGKSKSQPTTAEQNRSLIGGDGSQAKGNELDVPSQIASCSDDRQSSEIQDSFDSTVKTPLSTPEQPEAQNEDDISLGKTF